MARIKSEDVQYVKDNTNIADIIGDHVALKTAGIDSLKGLCPFHDERSPSFHVRPNLGYYHCFGCGESGDVISFLQQINHFSFAESIEFLADKLGYQLTYDDDFNPSHRTGPSKSRLLEANLAAQKYFESLLYTEAGSKPKQFLNERGFDDEALKKFGVGYSLESWDALTKHLRSKGFRDDELLAAGLQSQGTRNSYDRFRGRLMWPIRDASGSVLGFGARKVHDHDEGPKYLNTPETAVYHKSRVLYGIDLAKRSIAQNKQVIVVEGYTDVMACHLAGVPNAVATCGTAFGKEHIAYIRRMMGDDASASVIFTFDPDEAGQNAALKAFSNDHLFKAQTYVAVNSEGLDPSDLRQQKGDAALKNLFESTKPLFSFALQEEIKKFDLNSVEGRVSALRSAAPIVSAIKDKSVKQGYVRELANLLGIDSAQVYAAINSRSSGDEFGVQGRKINDSHRIRADSPGMRLERDALMVMLQLSGFVGRDLFEQAVTVHFDNQDFNIVRDGISKSLDEINSPGFVGSVLTAVPIYYQSLVRELSVTPLPQRNEKLLKSYAIGVIVSLLEKDLLSLKTELIARLQRLHDSGSAEYRATQEQIRMLEQARRALRAEASLE